MNILFSIILSITFCLQGFGQTFIGEKEDINKILANISMFSQYVMDSDYDKIANSYTEDGKIFPNNLTIIEGRDAIKEYWKLPPGVLTSYHKITPKEIKVNGHEAYDYGLYEGKTKRKNGEEVSWKGKYVIVWKKIDGNWMMYLDIWNRIAD
jgi:ketosteroid isomerase-like protein